MSVLTPPAPSHVDLPPAAHAIPDAPVFRLSVQQYHEMLRAGVLADGDPVELLEGWLIQKMSKNPPHRAATKLVSDVLRHAIPPGWYVDSQEPITTLESEPEPDVAVIRGTTRDYLDRHPGPGDLAIVVEISDATLDYDRRLKQRIYARAGIAVYWIVNLIERQVEVYALPTGPTVNPTYGQREDFKIDAIMPLMIAGTEIAKIAVAELLP